MCPGLSPNIQQIDDARKTAVIDRELSRLGVDIACLQETRLPDSGTLREKSYTFFWKGKPPEEPRQHGVGFAIKNTLMTSIEPPSAGTERILTLRLSTSCGSANIISVYAPTLYSTPEDKDQFYGALDDIISQTPSTDMLYLLGDFNARVGADHEAWLSCIGAYGRGKINENGQCLLELCCYHGLCVTNTFFPCKEIHQVSWRHPRSRHWHQLDLVLTRRKDLASVLLTRTYHSADCDTDHSLVASKVRIAPRKIHHSKKSGRPRVNTCNARNPLKMQGFLNLLNVNLAREMSEDDTTDLIWSHLRDSIYSAAISAYGKKEHNHADWFEAHWDRMEPVVEAKRKTLLAYKNAPNPTTLTALRVARKTSQQTARHCANTYWLNLCSRIQLAADVGDARGMYEGIKKATGPAPSKSAPLKTKTGDVITNQGKQLERCVEHYLELYATQNVVTDAALADTPDLPVTEELERTAHKGGAQ
ncbi:craniofacial development protein 2-like [Penaeus chinensis]|uniref:craniofacial development protein 2-like n=1 Tax=Penaeus chinensis TaxID=139456 RepID=UPI001FB6A84B|nr:craniofacial development protein 2-like [Penaeus chinensis]